MGNNINFSTYSTKDKIGIIKEEFFCLKYKFNIINTKNGNEYNIIENNYKNDNTIKKGEIRFDIKKLNKYNINEMKKNSMEKDQENENENFETNNKKIFDYNNFYMNNDNNNFRFEIINDISPQLIKSFSSKNRLDLFQNKDNLFVNFTSNMNSYDKLLLLGNAIFFDIKYFPN